MQSNKTQPIEHSQPRLILGTIVKDILARRSFQPYRENIDLTEIFNLNLFFVFDKGSLTQYNPDPNHRFK